VPGERLTIAQVTPFPWEAQSEINQLVRRVSDELSSRGHRVLILAPSQSRTLVRQSRRGLQDPASLLQSADGGPAVLAVGEVLGLVSARRRAPSLPVDVSRTIEAALTEIPFDVVHVHEPFAPSVGSVALRHSRALNVGSFHQPTERLLISQLARPLSRHLFGRLDARVASYAATAELLRTYFPGDYDVILPGADVADPVAGGARVRLLACAEEDRAGLRVLLRALRLLDDDLEWEATVWSREPWRPPTTLSRVLRERLRASDAGSTSQTQALAAADVLVLASEGMRPAPDMLIAGLAAGARSVASRLPVYEELLRDGDYGLQFEPGDVQTLAAHLRRVIAEHPGRGQPELRQRFSWPRVADELEALYGRLTARRHDANGSGSVRSRLSKRRLIDVDLHMHTDHSHDCATPVEVLLAEAKARGLGAIAVTDHNEISGALEARAKANGVKVIVAEEVKTRDQGEVIGLFIEEKIPRGMTLQETIAEIKRQGGLVYVPHPFDRLHSVPGYEHLLDVLDDIDAIEVFNPRVAISEFNDEAVRFAAKYRIPAGAGSDAHVPQGLGSVRIRMRDFDGPEEFLESLRDADILRNPASLLYVQALKFLQTRALPAPARRASRDRRVRRATGHTRRSSSTRRRRKS
jgi:glycosyltransferase involved in cell wall biosynthesis